MKFVQNLPPTGAGRPPGSPNQDYTWFRTRLQQQPGSWATLPEVAGKGFATSINRGQRGFTLGEYEAAERGGRVYVRYVGTSPLYDGGSA